MKKLLAKLVGWYFNTLVFFAPRLVGRQGFYLFSTPMRGALKDHHHEFLNTAQKFTFQSDGNTLQAFKWGTGPKVILFLHGWQSQTFRWKNYIQALSHEEFTIYAFDAPGHGQSSGKRLNLPIYSNALEEFIRQIEPVHTIVGHSLGSFAALHSYYRLESLPVKQMIVLATPGEVNDFARLYQQTLGLSERSVRAVRSGFLELIHHLPEYYSAPKFVQSIQVPGLIIHDEHDPETPYHHALAIHKAWKKSRLITTHGLGHNLRSASVVREVVNFIRGKSTEASLREEYLHPVHLN
ncbi:MAG: alpha/beta hydrolase [Cytophagales bacterium]|nr:alpha/beta hydrolase [Cytophagales bacterium]